MIFTKKGFFMILTFRLEYALSAICFYDLILYFLENPP